MTSVTKTVLILFLGLLQTKTILAQNSFAEQFDYAKKLYAEEKYFDAVTEFKRLLFFDESEEFNYEANYFMGLSFKYGGKFSEALLHFYLADNSASSKEQKIKCSMEIIKINILRRTTQRALLMLDSLTMDPECKNKREEINYWRGWAFIFSDEWKKASTTFSKIQSAQILVEVCDSVDNELYNPELAKYLSIIPGAGQFYTSEYVSGLLSIGWNVLWGYLTINAFVEDRVLDGVLIGSLLWWRFYSGNIQNAEKFAIEKNLEITNSALRYLQSNYSGSKP